jgi:peptidoglycan/LPS O-acetylase OafA/YrhL
VQGSRYAFLDGIRGIAAVFVLTRHTIFFSHVPHFRSYLAVDVFFILSGFVIAGAYEEKLRAGAISALDFIRIRIIRLYPVYFVSFLLCAFLFVRHTYSSKTYSLEDCAVVLLATAFFLPCRLPPHADLFPLNGPYWSLFFELVANVSYAVARPYLSDALLVFLVALAGSAVAVIGSHYNGLDAGFAWGPGQVAAGLSRSFFGIFLGVLIFRKRSSLGRLFDGFDVPWLAVLALVAILASPSLGWLNPYIDLACVFFLFPVSLIVASKGVGGRFEETLLYLGSASYPMYVLHSPLGDIADWLASRMGAASGLLVGIAFIAVMISFSVWLERTYDIPIRRRLTALIRRRQPFTVQSAS